MTSGVAPADFGPRMKRERETRGVTLREIATRTKISVSALEALERNDISRLPGGIFGRAFVRAYAEEVGLDPEQTIREFIEAFPSDTVTAGSPYVPAEDHAAVESSCRSAETAVKLAAISVPVAIAIVYFTMLRGPEPDEQPQPAPAADTAPLAAAPPPAAAAPALTRVIVVPASRGGCTGLRRALPRRLAARAPGASNSHDASPPCAVLGFVAERPHPRACTGARRREAFAVPAV